jgi:hypothetical protein
VCSCIHGSIILSYSAAVTACEGKISTLLSRSRTNVHTLCVSTALTHHLYRLHCSPSLHLLLGAMNARDDKQRQFAFRAAVSDSASKIGNAFGQTVGMYAYPALLCRLTALVFSLLFLCYRCLCDACHLAS